jgi:hypothetical protein
MLGMFHRFGATCLINAVTGEVGTGIDLMFGYPTQVESLPICLLFHDEHQRTAVASPQSMLASREEQEAAG